MYSEMDKNIHCACVHPEFSGYRPEITEKSSTPFERA